MLLNSQIIHLINICSILISGFNLLKISGDKSNCFFKFEFFCKYKSFYSYNLGFHIFQLQLPSYEYTNFLLNILINFVKVN